jgi:hypothetical protein
VIGFDDVPWVRDPVAASRLLELAVLSVRALARQDPVSDGRGHTAESVARDERDAGERRVAAEHDVVVACSIAVRTAA